MFTVLNSYRDNDNLLYAVRDFSSSSDLEIVTEEELKLLISLNMQMKDINDNIITLTGDTLNIQVDDITDQINEDIESEENNDADDFYSAYGDDEEVEENFEEDSEEDYEDEFSDYDEIYADYEEDEEPEGSVVSKLYESLNEEQIKVLKRYYLWYSQRLFNDAQKDPTLGLKNQKKIQAKKNALNQLRGSGEWRYAGFLDTGSKMAGYTCTLGHPLRYMHLAWDITVGDVETCFFGEDYNIDFEDVIRSNNCIVYGIKCIGDFFEVDSECIKNLQKAQRESLRDMAIMYDFYMNNTVDEAIKSFKFMDEVVSVIARKDIKNRTIKGSDYTPVIPLSAAAFYTQFRNANMIPPKSLVQLIRSCIVGWTNGKKYFSNKWVGELRYPENSFKDIVLPTILGLTKFNKDDLLSPVDMYKVRMCYARQFSDLVVNYLYIAFTYEICGVYKYDADINKDEGGKSKPVRAKLSQHYERGLGSIFEDLDYSIDTCNKLLQLGNIMNIFEDSYRNENFPVDLIISNNSENTMKFFLCQSSQSNIIEVVDEFDKETNSQMHDILTTFGSLNRSLSNYYGRRRNGFTSPLYSTDSRQFKLSEVYPIVAEKYSEFKTLYENFLKYAEKRNQDKIDGLKQRQEQERLEREAKEQQLERERLKKEKELEHEKEMQNLIDTPKKLVEYLEKNIAKVDSSQEWNLPKDILSTVVKSDKEPSDRQLYHLKRLYKNISGVDYTGVEGQTTQKIELSSRSDLKEAIEFILAHEDLIINCVTELRSIRADSTKVKGVLSSILKYGSISSRQLAYAEAANKIYQQYK